MPVSEAQRKAAAKYLEKLDEIRIRMPKGRKDIIQAHAAAQGESVNGFINRAIDHEMERDTTGGPQEAAEAPTGAGVVSLPSGAGVGGCGAVSARRYLGRMSSA